MNHRAVQLSDSFVSRYVLNSKSEVIWVLAITVRSLMLTDLVTIY